MPVLNFGEPFSGAWSGPEFETWKAVHYIGDWLPIFCNVPAKDCDHAMDHVTLTGWDGTTCLIHATEPPLTGDQAKTLIAARTYHLTGEDLEGGETTLTGAEWTEANRDGYQDPTFIVIARLGIGDQIEFYEMSGHWTLRRLT